MKIKHGIAAAAALAFLLITGVQTFAASPGRVSYQGTLRKNGILFSGTAVMEFRVTNADGSSIYWTSGSTGVVVSTGLFRYPLGTPNEASFDAISWKEITPYVQMSLDGGWLPREPLYTSVYSLHAKTSESSTGTFTINGGDLRLVAASGGKGIYFPDGTSQFSAPGWAVTGSYTSFAGGAGVGTLTPATRLDVKGAVADPYVQFWRDENGVIKATMTAAGVLYADGSQLSNLPAGADNMGSHTATQALNMAGWPINNSGSIIANGQVTVYSSATVTSSSGLGSAKLKLASGVEVSSYSAGGVFISSNVTLAAGGKYFGNGSMLTGVNDSLGNHIATQTLNMAGFQILNVSTVVVNRSLWFNNNVEISSSAGVYSGVYISTNISIAAGAKYYGDGSGLSGIVGTDNLGNHVMTQNLATGANWISSDGSPNGINIDALGNIGVGQAAGSASLDLRGTGGTYTQIWRNNAGVIKASMTAAGAFYADGSQLRNLPAGGTATQALNMAGYNIVSVSTISLSSVTSSGVGVVFSTNVLLMNGRLGVNTSLPQESLDVNGNIMSSSLSGQGNQCVYADNLGRLWPSGVGNCGSATGSDNLGNRIMLGNLITGSNWISFDGSNGGLSVNISSNVGIGVLSAATRLDVKARSGDTYVQIWRNSAGVEQASMSATGFIFADASKMRNLPTGGDSFGTHTATQPVNMAGFQLLNVSSVNFSANVEISSSTGLNRGIYVSTNIYIVGVASATKYYGDGSSLTGVISSPDNLGNHTATLNLTMSGKDIVSVSTISLSSVTSTGIGVVFSTNVLLMNGRLGVNTSLPQESLDVNGNFRSSSLSGSGNQCVYADNTGKLMKSGVGDCGSASGSDNLGNRIMLGNLITGSNWISFDGSNGGLSVNVSSNVGIGVPSAATRLDVQARSGDTYAQIWRNSGGVIQASMSAAGLMFADASQMRNLPSGADNLGNHTATTNLGMASFDITGVSTMTVGYLTSSGPGVVFSTNLLLMDGNLGVNNRVPQEKLDVTGKIRASSLSGSGFRCVQANDSGVLGLSADACGLAGVGGDNLGDYTMTFNLMTNNNWLSGDGGNEGVRIDALGNVSVGGLMSDVAAARFDIEGAAGTPIQAWRDNGGVVRASMSSGGGLTASSATVNGQLTVNSSATVTAALGVGAAKLRLKANVEISSETSTSLGGGVRISSNVYIVGFSSAAKYYGDGSSLTGLTGLNASNINSGTLADARLSANVPLLDSVNTFSSSFTVSNAAGAALSRVSFSGGAEISSAAAANYGGVQFSTNVYLPAGAKYYGDGSQLSGVSGSDNLGNHTATAALQMAGNQILNVSSVTVSGALGLGAVRIAMLPGVEISSAAAANYGGVQFSTNVYLPAGAKYYGDGSQLSGVSGSDNLGNHTATAVLQMAGFEISNAGAITSSSVTVSGALGLGAVRIAMLPGVELSSAAEANYGGVQFSTNVYLPAGAKYYGDGSSLTGTGQNASNIFSGTLADARLSANVPLLNAANIFTSKASFTAQDGSLPGVAISSGLTVLNGDVGIGTLSPQAKLDVNGGIRIGSTENTIAGTIRYNGAFQGFNGLSWDTLSGGYTLDVSTMWSSAGNNVYLASLSSNVAIGSTDAGTDKLRVRGATNDSTTNAVFIENSDATGIFTARNDGKVGLGPQVPATRLDVQAVGADTYVQIWRDSGSAYIASMTATGILYADGSKLRNLPPGNTVDTLSATLGAGNDAGGLNLDNVGAITAGGQVTTYSSATVAGALGLGAARLSLSPNVEISSETTSALGAGVRISSNIYVVGFSSAAKYYGNGSGLTNLNGAMMGLGNVTNVAQLPLSYLDTDTALAADSDLKVPSQKAIRYYVDNGLNNSTIVREVDLTGSDFSVAGGVVSLNYTGAQTAGSGLKGFLSGADWDKFNAKFGPNSDINLANTYSLVNVSSITAYGAITSYSSVTVFGALDVGANNYSQIWRDSGNVIMASMTAGGILYADGSQLRNVVGGGGGGGSLSTILASNPNAGNGSIVNVSSMAIGQVTADAALDVHALGGQNIVQTWRGFDGVSFAKMTLETGKGQFHTDDIVARTVEVSSNLAVGNASAVDNTMVVSILSSFSGSAIGDNNVGLNSAVGVDPSGDKTGAETLIGGNFAAALGAPGLPHGVSFPTLVGVRAGTLTNTGAAKTVSNGYGIYVQNGHLGGTLSNSYGINIARPNMAATVTNVYGLYIEDHSLLFGSPQGNNIYSKGANTFNTFEGTVVVGKLRLPAKTKAELLALTPVAEGEAYYCTSGCPAKMIVVSTGTAAGNFATAMGTNQW
ncbi:MAG: hypothetical protein PHV36_04775 [Elusimicrobiales bacterium]|nr:hypothetical protein [Elusimicrobiales bacterium]